MSVFSYFIPVQWRQNCSLLWLPYSSCFDFYLLEPVSFSGPFVGSPHPQPLPSYLMGIDSYICKYSIDGYEQNYYKEFHTDLLVDNFQIILVHTKLFIAILYKIAILAFAYVFVFALFIVHCLVQWISFLFFAVFPIHLLTKSPPTAHPKACWYCSRADGTEFQLISLGEINANMLMIFCSQQWIWLLSFFLQ